MELDNKKSTILFIPEAGIYPYLRSLSILGDAVTKSGGKVYLTHCTGQMLRCPMMAMHRLSTEASAEEKNKLCQKCQKQFKSAQKQYNFPVIELKDLMDNEILQLIDNLTNVPQENLENLMFKNVAVGKISEYDFSLETKTQIYPNLSKEHKALYTAYVKNTMLAVFLAEKIYLKYNPSIFITFNQYAQGQGVRAVAANNKVNFLATTHATHKNADASQVMLYEKLNTWFIHCQKWHSIKNVPILPRYVSECWEDTLLHFYGVGSHIFSKSKHGDPEYIFKKFALDPKKKTIVVYTSSNDERGGYEKLLEVWGDNANFTDAFSSQIAWLSWLREYAAKRDDVQIVVRIHPREGGRQFGFGSSHLEQLRAAFPENTESFFVVWPDDPISSYDLMELADLCLVPWTTVGQEAARVSIPVLSCTGGMYYPDDDFIQVGTSLEEYKRKLDSMINFEYTWQHLVKAVRFYHWRTFVPALDLEETVPQDTQDDTLWPSVPSTMISVIDNIIAGKEDLITYNIKKWQDSLPVNAVEMESEAMRRGIKLSLDRIFYPPKPKSRAKHILFRLYFHGYRFVWRKFFGNKKTLIKKTKYPLIDYSLQFTADVSRIEELCEKTKQDKNLRIIVADGLTAILIHKGKLLRRMSPMVIRLAKLYEASLKFHN